MYILDRTTRYEILSYLGGPGEMIEEGKSAIVKAKKRQRVVGGTRVELELEEGIGLVKEVN